MNTNIGKKGLRIVFIFMGVLFIALMLSMDSTVVQADQLETIDAQPELEHTDYNGFEDVVRIGSLMYIVDKEEHIVRCFCKVFEARVQEGPNYFANEFD